MAKNCTCLAYCKCTADIHTLLLVQNVPLVQHKLSFAIIDGDESRYTNTPRTAPQLINSTQERYRNIQRETEKGFCVKHTHQCSPSAPLSSLLSLYLYHCTSSSLPPLSLATKDDSTLMLLLLSLLFFTSVTLCLLFIPSPD